MQQYSHAPPVTLPLPTTQRNSFSRLPCPTTQVEYYSRQQIVSNQQNIQQSHGLWDGQSSFQPGLCSENLQSRQMQQMMYSNLMSEVALGLSSPTTATLPNGQHAPLQQENLTQNVNHHLSQQVLNRNIVPQQNYNTVPLNNVSGTSVSTFSLPVLPQYQSLNEHHHHGINFHQPSVQPQQMDLSHQVLSNQTLQNNYNNQGQIREGTGNGVLYGTYNQYIATSQSQFTPPQPSNRNQQTGQSHSSYVANQVHYSSRTHHQTLPNRTENNSASCAPVKHNGNKLPSHTSHTIQHFANQNQRRNQSAEMGLPQGNVQPQIPQQQYSTKQVSAHHSKTHHVIVPAIQGNTKLQDLLLNNTVTSLHRSSQVTVSSNTHTRPPPPTYTDSALNKFKATLMSLLTKPSQKQSTSPQQNPSHIPTKASYSETPESAHLYSALPGLRSKEIQRLTEYHQTPVQRTAILKENDVPGKQLTVPDVPSFERTQSRGMQTALTTQRKDGRECNNRHGEVQYIEDVDENLELVMAQQNVLQQARKAVAVVPPISQQVPSTENKNYGTTSSDDSLPFKINAVWSLDEEGKNVDQNSDAKNQPKQITEDLQQLISAPYPETPQCNKPEDETTVKSLGSDTPSSDIPPSKIDSTTSQGPVCSPVLASEPPEELNNVKTDKSNSNIVDLSKVEALNFTMESFNNWVKSLENQQEKNIKEPDADIVKHLLELYWDGKAQNLEKQLRMLPAVFGGLISQVSIKDMHTAVFQYLQPKDLKKLKHCCHILKNDTNLPTEEFRSSWLNVDGQPADIENFLAEPILDLNLTEYDLPVDYDTVYVCSESEPSTKASHAETFCQDGKMFNKELTNWQVCERKSVDKISNTQEPSKKHEDENLEKHLQQSQNLNPEESEESNEIADTLSESTRTECEQVCGDARRDFVTSSKTSSELVEQRDLTNEADSSNDPKLTEPLLQSPTDTKTILKEPSGCNLQKESSQLCPDETMVPVTLGNESKDFCNSGKQIKFTCPHVADTKWENEHFCPRCWEETTVLDLDLEAALFSPGGSSSNMSSPGHHDPICSPQSCSPDSNCTALSENSSIAGSPTPEDDVSEVTLLEPALNPGDAVESSEQNLENPIVPAQTKNPRDEVSPPKYQPHKKLKLSKHKREPVDDTLNKKGSSKKTPPAEDDQKCRDEIKETEEERNSPFKQKFQIQVSEPDKPELNINICSASSSDSSSLTTCGVNMSLAEPDTDLCASTQSFNSPDKQSELSNKLPDEEVQGCVPSEGVKLTMPIIVQECEPQSFANKTVKRKTDIPSPTIASKEKVSPPRYPPCKKVKVNRTISGPPEDDLFTPDIVVKKASTPSPNPSDVQHPFKDDRNEKGKERNSPVIDRNQHSGQTTTDTHGKLTTISKSQVLNDEFQPERTAVAANSNADNKKILGKTKPTEQNKEVKNMKFALYGFNNGNRNGRNVQQQFYKKTKSSSAPVYITISNVRETSQRNTDAPSAKQKVYRQWSNTFVGTKKQKKLLRKIKML